MLLLETKNSRNNFEEKSREEVNKRDKRVSGFKCFFYYSFLSERSEANLNNFFSSENVLMRPYVMSSLTPCNINQVLVLL